MAYYSGQGKVRIGRQLPNGYPGVLRDLGNIPGASIDPKATIFDHQESSSGFRATDLRLLQEKSISLKFDLESFDPKNLALQFLGADSVIAAGTVTGEALPSGILAGDLVALRQQNVSSVVLTDSAGTPAPLTAGTHYRVDSAGHGTIEFLDVASFTPPFHAAYSYDEAINITMLNQDLTEYWVRFEGLNTADGRAPVLIELYRVQFDLVKTLELIQDKGVSKGAMEGMVLIDTAKVDDPVLGQFGRVVML